MAKLSLISIPALMVPSVPANAIATLLHSPRKGQNKASQYWNKLHNSTSWLLLLALFGCVSMLKFVITWHPREIISDACYQENSNVNPFDAERQEKMGFITQLVDFPVPLQPHSLDSGLKETEREFWRQPDSLGYKPCIDFSVSYRKASPRIMQQNRKFLIVVVAGGLNQQRNQIVDAVVIARILEAALILPIMQVNVIWGDNSEFSDIFDVDHFKDTLKGDVRILSSLPSTHIMTRPVEEKRTPLHASPQWFRTHYLKRFNREGVLLLRGLDSRLSKDLPSDLQKLRCKVAFHALKFAAPIEAVGHKLAERMWGQGPYLALHLRLEKDVWVRTGCLPGLGKKYDDEIKLERILKPNLLTGRSNMSYEERKLAGLCPLNAAEVVRLLKAFGAPKRTRIYWAGGEPFGGDKALEPLQKEFSYLYNKDTLALPEELQPFRKKASSLAAIDYLVSLNSDVFMPSHGGNMAHSLKGHRAFTGHRKHITPNKREMLPYFLNSTISQLDFDNTIKRLHNESMGQPAMWKDKKGRDVIGYPVPECMCQQSVTD
ncbi:hypothetical protein O6H91_17G037300 [Diphasiastrum complanatum]|uniref:Uncharacterized protein n=1 Tax=Diphasiastrum complanatum TaxID=34168 RepID=A0ACC2B5S9_DIPCM|nr:hypothetical protein O6H91_17G037300 [Diphasiastrum complanatum]